MKCYSFYLFLLFAIPSYGQIKKSIFYSPGVVMEEYFVSNDDTLKLDGEYKKYYIDGKVSSQSFYKDAKKEGAQIEYYENGKVKFSGNFKNGIRSGRFEYYDIKGNLSSIESYDYAEGGENGTYKQFFPSQKLAAEGFLKKGALDSTLTEYYLSGKIKSKKDFRNGKFEVFSEAGGLLQKGYIKDGELNDTVTSFHAGSNQVQRQAFYSLGKLNGTLNEYYA
ncbi:MAG TPA: hypothetical protein VF691_09320, partial [Cytophagaceae bacterium]